jgi:hypothetical protein
MAMRASALTLAIVAACGGPAAPAAPSNVAGADPLQAVNWMDREYKLFGKSFKFTSGKYADSETVLRIVEPTYLDVTGDGAADALLPLQIDEAETAREQGNPRFHSFLVLTSADRQIVQLGELPPMTCGPLRAELELGWLSITSTRRGTPGDMCGGPPTTMRYRWDGTWFVNEEGDEIERNLP